MKITAIAFDWGGVFTEGTFDSGAVRDLSKAFGVSEEEIGETYFPLMEEFEAGAFELPEFHERFLKRSGLRLDYETFKNTFLDAVREREGMFRVLDATPSSYAVGMLSNNVPVLCDRVRDDERYRRIERFVFSNEIGVRKPDPRAFRALSEALRKPPEETVFIDDNEGNIAACLRLGYHGILLDSLESFKVQWQKLLPDVVDLRG